MFHQPQNTNSLRDTGNNISHKVLEGEFAVKLHAKDVEVGTSSDRYGLFVPLRNGSICIR